MSSRQFDAGGGDDEQQEQETQEEEETRTRQASRDAGLTRGGGPPPGMDQGEPAPVEQGDQEGEPVQEGTPTQEGTADEPQSPGFTEGTPGTDQGATEGTDADGGRSRDPGLTAGTGDDSQTVRPEDQPAPTDDGDDVDVTVTTTEGDGDGDGDGGDTELRPPISTAPEDVDEENLSFEERRGLSLQELRTGRQYAAETPGVEESDIADVRIDEDGQATIIFTREHRREQAIERAAERFDVAPEDLEIDDGMIVPADVDVARGLQQQLAEQEGLDRGGTESSIPVRPLGEGLDPGQAGFDRAAAAELDVREEVAEQIEGADPADVEVDRPGEGEAAVAEAPGDVPGADATTQVEASLSEEAQKELLRERVEEQYPDADVEIEREGGEFVASVEFEPVEQEIVGEYFEAAAETEAGPFTPTSAALASTTANFLPEAGETIATRAGVSAEQFREDVAAVDVEGATEVGGEVVEVVAESETPVSPVTAIPLGVEAGARAGGAEAATDVAESIGEQPGTRAAATTFPFALGEPTLGGEAVVLAAGATGAAVGTYVAVRGDGTEIEVTDEAVVASELAVGEETQAEIETPTEEQRQTFELPEGVTEEQVEIAVPSDMDGSSVTIEDGEISIPAEAAPAFAEQVVEEEAEEDEEDEEAAEEEEEFEEEPLVPEEMIPEETVVIGTTAEVTEEQQQELEEEIERQQEMLVPEQIEGVQDADPEETVAEETFPTFGEEAVEEAESGVSVSEIEELSFETDIAVGTTDRPLFAPVEQEDTATAFEEDLALDEATALGQPQMQAQAAEVAQVQAFETAFETATVQEFATEVVFEQQVLQEPFATGAGGGSGRRGRRPPRLDFDLEADEGGAGMAVGEQLGEIENPVAEDPFETTDDIFESLGEDGF